MRYQNVDCWPFYRSPKVMCSVGCDDQGSESGQASVRAALYSLSTGFRAVGPTKSSINDTGRANRRSS